jgi:sporulation protein YlmC with PRC-barrel domain
MTNDTTIDESAEGKQVISSDGEEVGMVTGVRGDRIYVDPNPGLTDKISSKLGWENIEEDDYSIRENSISRVTDDEIHLGRM